MRADPGVVPDLTGRETASCVGRLHRILGPLPHLMLKWGSWPRWGVRANDGETGHQTVAEFPGRGRLSLTKGLSAYNYDALCQRGFDVCLWLPCGRL